MWQTLLYLDDSQEAKIPYLALSTLRSLTTLTGSRCQINQSEALLPEHGLFIR